MGSRTLTVAEVDALAADAHAGQLDAGGAPYIEHPRAVAAGLVPFGEHLVMAGLLHDVIEDTTWTAEALLAAGLPPRVVEIVALLTKAPGTRYDDMLHLVADDREAALVKIADNAHNSRSDRNAILTAEQREWFDQKYSRARAILWPAVRPADLRAVLEIVNPALLCQVPGSRASGAGRDAGVRP